MCLLKSYVSRLEHIHSISHQERQPFGCQMRGYIATKLHSTHIGRPISLIHTHQAPQVLVGDFIHMHHFSVRLGLEDHAKPWFQLDLHREVPPKCTCEFWISIPHNHSWQTVVHTPCIEKGLYGLQRGCGSNNRHHVCQLGKPLYHHQDGIIPLWLRQTFDEIHAHTMSWPQQYRQWLHEPNSLLVRGSVHLALYTSLH